MAIVLFIVFSFLLCLSTDWVDASLTIWLSFPISVPGDNRLLSAVALYLILRRGLIIILGNTGVITCSELLGTLIMPEEMSGSSCPQSVYDADEATLMHLKHHLSI